MSHLYVMQNHLGLIKIGRSINVEQRRRNLERAENCKVNVIAIVENGGHLEERILVELDRHRLIGEWFDGDEEAKHDVETAFKRPLEWLFDLAQDNEIDSWLGELEKARIDVSVDRETSRIIREMSRVESARRSDPSRFYDVHIWTLIWRFERQRHTLVHSTTGPNGNLVLLGAYGDDEPELVPKFTSVVEAALDLWPPDVRPNVWFGSAWDCCVAALEERRKSRTRTRNKMLGS